MRFYVNFSTLTIISFKLQDCGPFAFSNVQSHQSIVETELDFDFAALFISEKPQEQAEDLFGASALPLDFEALFISEEPQEQAED